MLKLVFMLVAILPRATILTIDKLLNATIVILRVIFCALKRSIKSFFELRGTCRDIRSQIQSVIGGHTILTRLLLLCHVLLLLVIIIGAVLLQNATTVGTQVCLNNVVAVGVWWHARRMGVEKAIFYLFTFFYFLSLEALFLDDTQFL